MIDVRCATVIYWNWNSKPKTKQGWEWRVRCLRTDLHSPLAVFRKLWPELQSIQTQKSPMNRGRFKAIADRGWIHRNQLENVTCSCMTTRRLIHSFIEKKTLWLVSSYSSCVSGRTIVSIYGCIISADRLTHTYESSLIQPRQMCNQCDNSPVTSQLKLLLPCLKPLVYINIFIVLCW